MFKRIKIYPLLLVIVVSALIGLLSPPETAHAECPSGETCATWGYSGGAISPDVIQYNNKSYDKLSGLLGVGVYRNSNNACSSQEDWFTKQDNVYVNFVEGKNEGSIIFFGDSIDGDSAKEAATEVYLINDFDSVLGPPTNEFCGPGTSTSIPFDQNAPAPTTPGDNDSDDPPSNCKIGGLGWLICPAMTLLGEVTDKAREYVFSALETEVRFVLSDSTQTAWGMMRNLANIVFAFIFLVVIYSQMTGAGIGNYGVKRMLPRLVIAAVLVNLSYILCQVAVDMSNLLGYGSYNMFSGLVEQMTVADPADPGGTLQKVGTGAVTWTLIIGSILIAGATIVFAVSGPVLLAALLALALIVLILVARVVLIVILIIMAPLAIAAFILPNTEQWFKKWYTMLLALLMVFPIVAIVFGASELVSTIILSVANSGDDGPDMMMQVIALGASAVPLFVVPGLLRNSMSATGQLGAKLSGMASNRQSAALSKGKTKLGESRLADLKRHGDHQAAIRRQRVKGGTYKGKLPLSWAASKMNSRFNDSKLSGEFGDKAAASALAFEDEYFEKEVKAAALEQSQWTNDDRLAMATTEEGAVVKRKDGSVVMANGKEVRATKERISAASDGIMTTGGFGQRQELLAHAAGGKDQALKARAVRGAYAKGDQNIYGVGFGDKILSGSIKDGAGLTNAAVQNAADGDLQAEHLVQSGSATKWLQEEIGKSGDTAAQSTFKARADEVMGSEHLRGKVDGKMEQAFNNASGWGTSAAGGATAGGTTGTGGAAAGAAGGATTGSTTGGATGTAGGTGGGTGAGGTAASPAPGPAPTFFKKRLDASGKKVASTASLGDALHQLGASAVPGGTGPYTNAHIREGIRNLSDKDLLKAAKHGNTIGPSDPQAKRYQLLVDNEIKRRNGLL